ncbi:HAD family hydrolase [Holdemania massiliensis]|uniref:HAD family hydrolase n=1 Tax=Holdemania massiliensis TaxID=1468449 RepID=UPI00267692B1|nr:HAD family hydrolase [Holdemania massiliensis]
MKYKIAVVDLDQTLLYEDKTLSERTVQALSRFAQKGKVVVATGRAYSRSIEYVRKLNAQGLIALNGAVVYDQEQIVAKQEINAEKTKTMIEALLKADQSDVLVIYPDINYGTISDFIASGWCKKLDMNKFNPLEIQKIFWFTPCHEYFDQFNVSQYGCRMIVDKENPDCRIIMNEKVNKLEGLKILCKRWNVSLDEIVAFGDDMNDLELFQECGWSVAVSNALPMIKEVAKEVCASNEEEGVAQWMEAHAE